MGEMIWGVRRRDAARHNESGWLIRPKTGDALLLSLSLGIFIFIFIFIFILFTAHTSPTSACRRAGQKESLDSRYADPSGPVREHFWEAPVAHPMTWSIASV